VPVRAAGLFVLRSLARIALAIWFGGFTFYAAVVVPDLHDTFSGPETGEVSRRVVIPLYAIGFAAAILAGTVAAVDPAGRSGWRGKLRLALLAAMSLLLLALVAIHRVMGARLDAGGSRGDFFPLHEAYLTVFAIQWGASLGLLAVEPREIARSGRTREDEWRGSPGPSEIVDRAS